MEPPPRINLREKPPTSLAAAAWPWQEVGPWVVYAFLLLGILAVAAFKLMPVYPPELQKGRIASHSLGKNYIIAQRQVTKLLTAPAAWRGPVDCAPVGGDVWYAAGRALVSSPSGEKASLGWKIYFVPATTELLYAEAGDTRQGDLAAALSRAHREPSSP